jgi:hypothetical protein
VLPTITLTGVQDWTMPGHRSAVKRSALSASLSQPAIWSGQNEAFATSNRSIGISPGGSRLPHCVAATRGPTWPSRRRRRDSD